MEMWKDIQGYEGLYQVSNYGRVRSLEKMVNAKCGSKRVVKGAIIGYKNQKNGYMYVKVSGKQVLMHRLVWEAFNGEIPQEMEIDHINTIRDDNRLENLRLVTSKENSNNPITLERYKESNKGKISDKFREILMARKKYDLPKDRKEYAKEYSKRYYQEHKEEINKRRKKQ